MKKHFNLICCLGLALVTNLHAQTDSVESEGSGRRVWVAMTTMPEDVANPLSILSDEKIHKEHMSLRAVSRPIPVDKTGLVRVVKAAQKPDGTLVYLDLMRAVVPKEVREALIVMLPNDEEGGLKFNSKVIDLSQFKKGGCLYVNLTKTKLGIIVGDHETGEKTKVEPGGVAFINPLKNSERKGVFPVQFLYEIPKKPAAEWKLMTSSKMAIYDSRREICVFFFNKEIENVDFRGIPFMTPKPRPKPR